MRNSTGCDLAWRRDGANWVLRHKRRRMGRVTPDHEYRGMYRVVLSHGRLSDMANLSWAKDAALAVLFSLATRFAKRRRFQQRAGGC
jgi:hypothetical protein